jgi:predicted dehydrogenase
MKMSVNVGIVGFAHGHVHAYITEWNKNKELQVKVVGGWDHDAGRLEEAVKTYGITPYNDLNAMLSSPDIQAVVITSETSMHADLVEKAAAAGKMIIVQKPLALTLSQADRIVEAVHKYKVPFTMAWQMRVDPQNMKMKELIESGILGKIYMVRRRHGLSTHLWAGFKDTWHVNPEFNRDIWADDAAHPVDFINWLLGAPESVTAEIVSLNSPQIPMDNGVALLRYQSGPMAEVCCSFTCVAGENTTEIIAEKGTIIQNYGDVPSCNVPRPEGACGLKWYLTESNGWTYSDILSPQGHGERISGLAKPLAEFLNGKREPIATAEEARTSLRMNLACYVSVREGRRVSFDDAAIELI